MRFTYFLLILGLTMLSAKAQEAFSLSEAVAYAKQNNVNTKNAVVDIEDAELQIQELKRTGLPQINGQFQYTYNAIVPTQIIPAKTFNPQAGDGDVVKVKFGLPWGGQAGIGLNQLIFDGSYLVGLRAADTYRQLAGQNKRQADINVTENVMKAYYSAQVAEERAKLLELNVNRLDSLIRDTQILYNEGFVEQIDVMRLEVQRNNLITEQQRVASLISLSYQLLKFQMGYPHDKPLELTDKLSESQIDSLRLVSQEDVDYNSRVEYSVLQTQRRLTELSVERIQKGALPSVFFTGNLGASHSNTSFNPFERWFPASALSISMQVPIYDSGVRKTRVQREQLNLIKIDNGATQMKESFELQNTQALTNLQNGLKALDVQKRNLELAKEVLRVADIKYRQGVGSNIEVVNAEVSQKEAQTNFFAALYDVLVAKVDLDKARGLLN